MSDFPARVSGVTSQLATLASSWATPKAKSGPPAQAATLASDLSGSEGETLFVLDGLKGGTTVGVAGIPAVDSAHTGIVFVKKEDLVSGVMCGGKVGKSKKMCVKTGCKVVAHSSPRLDLFQGMDADGTIVAWEELAFIVAHTDNKGPTQVFAEPVLPKVLMSSQEVKDWSVRSMSLDAWKMLFESAMEASHDKTSSPLSDVNNKTLQKILATEEKTSLALTPAKKPKVHFENQGTESPESFIDLDYEVPQSMPEGSTDMKLDWMEIHWPALSKNVEKLAELTNELHRNKALSDENFELRLSRLNSLVGERKDLKTGVATIVDAVTDLLDSLEEVKDESGNLKRWKEQLEPNLRQMVTDAAVEIYQATLAEGGIIHDEIAAPLYSLLTQVSSAKDKIGDVLWNRFDEVERKLANLEQSMKQEPSAATQHTLNQAPSVGQFSLGQTVWSSGVPSSNSRPTATQGVMEVEASSTPSLVEQVQKLRKEVEELQASIDTDSVTIGGKTFKSKRETKQFVALHSMGKAIHAFVDPMSLVTIGNMVSATATEVAQERVLTNRIGDGSIEYSKYLASFRLQLPEAIATKKEAKGENTSRTLSAMPTFEAWDTEEGRDGLKESIEEMVETGENVVQEIISLHLTGDAAALAKDFLSASKAWWIKFSAFVSDYYKQLLKRNDSSPKECWMLVVCCIRKVFKLLYDARSIGQAYYPESMLWGTLRAHAVCAELSHLKFQGHQEIAVILHQHLIDNSVPRSKFEDLVKEISSLKKSLEKVKTTADGAMSKASKK